MIKKNNSKIAIYFLLFLVLCFASTKMKELILDKISQSNSIEFSNILFSFCEVHNTGAAFNLMMGRTNMLIVAAIVCLIILIAIVLAKTSKLTNAMIIAMAFLSSGMLMNTVERVHDGFVTDYIYFTFFKEFPVFNLSDVMIVIGAIVIIISLLRYPREKK